MAKPINEGDVVRLKSGGPDMTVSSVKDGRMAYCRWFLDNGELKVSQFPLVSLMQAYDDQPD